MKKGIASLFLAAVLAIVLGIVAFADDSTIVASGSCGSNVTWTLDSDGLLTISGEGRMKDYVRDIGMEGKYECVQSPWSRYGSKIKNVYIQDGVTAIGEGAFHGCSKLTSVTIPDGVTHIGRSTFSGCSKLTSVTIPEGVTHIGERAFKGCSSLTSVTIPEGVTYIGECAFKGCSSLTSLTIPVSVTEMGRYVITDCSNLKEVYYGGTESQWMEITCVDWFGSQWEDDSFGEVYFDGQKSAMLKATPDFLTSTGKPYIKWKAVDGAAKYEVYRSTSETGNYKWLRTTTQLNYTDTTAELGRNYYYKVRPIGIGGFAGNMSEPVRALCHCSKPKMNSAQYLTATGKPYLTWSVVDGASKYQVYRAASKNGTYKLLGTTTKLSYTDTATNTGYTYFYKVKAVCKGNSSATSAYSAAVSAISHCAKPVVKTGYIASSGKPYLKWSTIIGASKYYVYRSSNEGGPYKYIGSTTGTSYTDPSAYAGYTYYYKVKAISRIKTSANSVDSTVVMTVCHCAKPVVKITTTSSGDPKLTWRTVTGASKYEVYRATSRSGTYTKVATTTAKTYINKTAKAGKTYYYKVKAVSKVKTSANSAYSAVKSIKAR